MVTLTTDFGTADGYVGAVKGSILSVNPKAHLVDLSNEIPSYDIIVGAYHLGNAFHFYPKGTIHLAVVDPGVGSNRRPLLIVTKNYYFVGPDNGLFTRVVQKDPALAIYELTEKCYFRTDVSHTFHGRDLFGPVAAHLSLGVSPAKFGKKREGMKLLPDFTPVQHSEGIFGKILFFDKFGNAFSNIQGVKSFEWKCVVLGGQEIPLYRTYSEIPKGEAGAIFGSSGFLEIALREDSFQNKCSASKKGVEILLKRK